MEIDLLVDKRNGIKSGRCFIPVLIKPGIGSCLNGIFSRIETASSIVFFEPFGTIGRFTAKGLGGNGFEKKRESIDPTSQSKKKGIDKMQQISGKIL